MCMADRIPVGYKVIAIGAYEHGFLPIDTIVVHKIGNPPRAIDSAIGLFATRVRASTTSMREVSSFSMKTTRARWQRFAGLGEKARIFNSDHCLRGEILQHRDLVFGKRPHLLPIDRDDAEYALFFPKRHLQSGTRAAEID